MSGAKKLHYKETFSLTLEEKLFKSRRFVFRGEFGSTTEDPLPRERTAQALALAGTASAVGRLVVNVLTIVSTMKYEIQRWNFLE